MKTKVVATERVRDNYLNTDTGEVEHVSERVVSHRIITGDGEVFVKMFRGAKKILDTLDKVSIKVLSRCTELSTYNPNIVHLTKPVLVEISKDAGIEVQTIRNSISGMVKKKALFRMGSGMYQVNPLYFWSGTEPERKKAILKLVKSGLLSEEEIK